MTPESFRQRFRQFANPDLAPEDAVNFWIGIAGNFFNASSSPAGQRWDATSLDYVTGLFVAHHLALDGIDLAIAQAGGVPGQVKGPASAKAVDKVSQSYDTKAVTFENEPFWNQTRFGVQLLELVKMFGAGGIQLGACGSLVTTTAWPTFGINFPG